MLRDRLPISLEAGFRLDDRVIMPRAGSVARGATQAHLEPRVMRVLVCLAERQGQVVTRQELLDTVWPGVVVEEGALARCVSDIRRALGDDRRRPRFIRTISKSGYQLLVEPAPIEEPVRRQERSRLRWPLIAGAVVATAALCLGVLLRWPNRPARPRFTTVAVMPFEDLSIGPGQSYFAPGITQEIIAQLTKMGRLRVVARDTGAWPVMSRPDEAGRLRGVDALLQGKVALTGGIARIDVELLRIPSSRCLWAQTYYRALGDVLDVQQDVAIRVAGALRAQLTPHELEAIRRAPTEARDAYTYYLRAREQAGRFSQEGFENAAVLLERAIEIDPEFALAHAVLGAVHCHRVVHHGLDEFWLERATAEAMTALELEPDMPEALCSLGIAYLARRDPETALPLFVRARELRPGYYAAADFAASSNEYMSRFDEALRWRLLAAESGWTPEASFTVAHSLCELGLVDAARQWYARGATVAPRLADALVDRAICELWAGDAVAASALVEEARATYPDWTVFTYLAAGYVLQATGQLDESRVVLERAIEGSEAATVRLQCHLRLAVVLRLQGAGRAAEPHLDEVVRGARSALRDGSEGVDLPWLLAAAYALRGDNEEALRWYERAVDARYRQYRWDLIDPAFEGLRNDERFQRQVERMRRDVARTRRNVEQSQWFSLLLDPSTLPLVPSLPPESRNSG